MRKKLFIALFIAAGFGPLLGQSPPRHAERRRTTLQAQKYSTDPFADNKPLLPNYYGHNIKQIIAALQKGLNTTKGEFETTAEYQVRAAKALTTPFLGSLTTQSVYAFQISLSTITYDADMKRFNVEIPLYGVLADQLRDPARRVLMISYEKRDGPSYVGTNAFGAMRDVESTYNEHYEIGFNADEFAIARRADKTLQKLGMSGESEFFDVVINNVDTQRARSLKTTLRSLAICRLIQPFLGTHESYNPATFEIPLATSTNTFELNTQLIDIWVYDFQTGTVYGKATHVRQK